MRAPTPWRRLLYKELEKTEIKGNTIDLGGSRNSGYHEILKGSKDITVVNFDPHYGFDMKFNIEDFFPLADKSYDTVLCINTLEHVYDHVHVIKETRRILKNDGEFIIAVPFIMFVHPCPNDYWRYTEQTVTKLLNENGFSRVDVLPVGEGPYLAALQIIYPSLKLSLFRNIAYGIAWLLDMFAVLGSKDKRLSKQYPLGYLIKARS